MVGHGARRGVALGALALVVATVLAGCSPDNVTGIGLASDGMPLLRNCGAWFRAVQATDEQSGRVVWSAAKRSGASEFGVDKVTVGLLPDKDWEQQSPLSRDPRPVIWRFAIQFRESGPQTVDVSDADLVAGALVVSGRSGHISEKAFRDDLCGYAPLVSGRTVLVSLGLVGLLGVIAVFLARRKRRRAV
jgi:hypothetical protein